MSDLNKFIKLMRHLSKQLMPTNYRIQKVDFIAENSSDNFQEQTYVQQSLLDASFHLMNNGNFVINISDEYAPTDLFPLRGFYSIENSAIFFTAQSEYVDKIGYLIFVSGTITKDKQLNYSARLTFTSRMMQLAHKPLKQKEQNKHNTYEIILLLTAL